VKKWQWILLAIIAYFIFLIAYTPAQLVASYVQDSSQNKVRFNGVEGTLFSGTASKLSYEGLQVDDVHWELSALSLLILQANLDITGGAIRNTDKIFIDGNISLSLLNPQAIKVSKARIFAPAKPLLAQVELPVVVTALGRFRIDLEHFEFDEGCKELKGNGNWLKAALNINGKPLDLDSFNAALSCEEPNFVMQVTPDNGISLDAKITLNQNGNYAALGTYAIPADFPNEIKQGTPFFGPSLGQGRHKLEMKSRGGL
jgi:general secretion pathway protein N